MKREGTFGAAALLAILAVVGISLQPGSKSGESEVARTQALRSRPATADKAKPAQQHNAEPWCSSLQWELQDFLHVKINTLPEQCYLPGWAPRPKHQPDLAAKTEHLKFVIALTPDPVHTHLSVLFDQFAVAIQEGAQDENYDLDSSWMPWDTEGSSYSALADERAANQEKSFKEDEPGIILFRKSLSVPVRAGKQAYQQGYAKSYSEGLVVFVVGEEATEGIHREQFRNALRWLRALQPGAVNGRVPVGILGPSFSGSIPSLVQVLSEGKGGGIVEPFDAQELAIFSGSISSKSSAESFQAAFSDQIRFHSFVEDDDEILCRFLAYMKGQQNTDPDRVAILSEDETAYGGKGVSDVRKAGLLSEDETACGRKEVSDVRKAGPLRMYYPRDISALRGAYQSKSLFGTATPSQAAETSLRRLPTDLADPAGNVRDSIRSYGGNQTPLVQEAALMEIGAELRNHQIEYVLLRGSNTLDQLFLTNFLRRSYPDGRIVIFSSDLMFIRERGTNALSGVMVLSTYPLFPLQHEWTQHPTAPSANRVFSGEGVEATYIALRLLLNDKSLNGEKTDPQKCHVNDDPRVFLPSVSCNEKVGNDYFPIPDYSGPFWMTGGCGELQNPPAAGCPYPGPPTWLSVIAVNRFWPLASLTGIPAKTPNQSSDGVQSRKKIPGGRPETTLEMKIFFCVLAGFSVFHAWCCWSGSYTAKPAFRAHFASQGDWCHTWLVFVGSCCVAFMAVVAGMGCGVFFAPKGGLDYPFFALICTIFVVMVAWLAVIGHGRTVKKLVGRSPSWTKEQGAQSLAWRWQATDLFFLAVAGFWLAVVFTLAYFPATENPVFVFWRAMHITSGVSPTVPLVSLLVGLYIAFWLSLHGLALVGPDRPRLPFIEDLLLKNKKFLRMFSQEDAARDIEKAAFPLTWKLFSIFMVVAGLSLIAGFAIANGVPIRSLGSRTYGMIFLVGLDLCCALSIVEAWRLYGIWAKVKRLLSFLDRLPLRRTMASLHGFSWGSVWKMSGNVLEVRYKVISRQMESMNHAIASLEQIVRDPVWPGPPPTRDSLASLLRMRRSGMRFADWYSTNYATLHTGDLTRFERFQEAAAAAAGTLLSKLLVPVWRLEQDSLIAAPPDDKDKNDNGTRQKLPQEKYIRNAEELTCLVYLGFVQNVLGRLRTIALTTVVLFFASTLAISTYPFDPRQGLSAVLIALFVTLGAVIVKVYAEMHRDSTLSHVTKTKPGELGTEFWFKVIGFGIAPVLGLLTRIFPGVMDFVFSWLQPSMSTIR